MPGTDPGIYSKTFVIKGPLDAGPYQIFSCTGTGKVTGLKESYPEWFDATPILAAFNSALESISAGGKIIASGTYTLADQWNINKACTVDFGASGNITFSKANTPGINFQTSDIILKHPTLIGPQYATYQIYERAITNDATVGSPHTGIRIENPIIYTWGGSGIYLYFAKSVVVNPRIYNVVYLGVMNYCGDMQGYGGYISNITQAAAGSSYGISYSKGAGTLAAYPRPTGTWFGGLIDGVPLWEGIDIHAGDGVRFIGTVIKNCKIGASNSYASDDPDNVSINSGFIDCHADSGVTDGTMRNGFELAGAATNRARGIFAIGCTAQGYGSATLLLPYAGFYVNNADDFLIDNYRAINCAIAGITVNKGTGRIGKGFVIDPWGYTATYAYGFGVVIGENSKVDIDGLSTQKSSLAVGATKTYLTNSIYIQNYTDNNATFGHNVLKGYSDSAIWDNRAAANLKLAGQFDLPGGLGQAVSYKSKEELVTIAAAATSVSTITIPAGVIVQSVAVRVTTIIPTAATFTVTGDTSTTVFNTAAVAVAAGTTNPGTAAGAYYNAASQVIRITPNGTPANNTGRVRVIINYIESIAPTS